MTSNATPGAAELIEASPYLSAALLVAPPAPGADLHDEEEAALGFLEDASTDPLVARSPTGSAHLGPRAADALTMPLPGSSAARLGGGFLQPEAAAEAAAEEVALRFLDQLPSAAAMPPPPHHVEDAPVDVEAEVVALRLDLASFTATGAGADAEHVATPSLATPLRSGAAALGPVLLPRRERAAGGSKSAPLAERVVAVSYPAALEAARTLTAARELAARDWSSSGAQTAVAVGPAVAPRGSGGQGSARELAAPPRAPAPAAMSIDARLLAVTDLSSRGEEVGAQAATTDEEAGVQLVLDLMPEDAPIGAPPQQEGAAAFDVLAQPIDEELRAAERAQARRNLAAARADPGRGRGLAHDADHGGSSAASVAGVLGLSSASSLAAQLKRRVDRAAYVDMEIRTEVADEYPRGAASHRYVAGNAPWQGDTPHDERYIAGNQPWHGPNDAAAADPGAVATAIAISPPLVISASSFAGVTTVSHASSVLRTAGGLAPVATPRVMELPTTATDDAQWPPGSTKSGHRTPGETNVRGFASPMAAEATDFEPAAADLEPPLMAEDYRGTGGVGELDSAVLTELQDLLELPGMEDLLHAGAGAGVGISSLQHSLVGVQLAQVRLRLPPLFPRYHTPTPHLQHPPT